MKYQFSFIILFYYAYLNEIYINKYKYIYGNIIINNNKNK